MAGQCLHKQIFAAPMSLLTPLLKTRRDRFGIVPGGQDRWYISCLGKSGGPDEVRELNTITQEAAIIGVQPGFQGVSTDTGFIRHMIRLEQSFIHLQMFGHLGNICVGHPDSPLSFTALAAGCTRKCKSLKVISSTNLRPPSAEASVTSRPPLEASIEQATLHS